MFLLFLILINQLKILFVLSVIDQDIGILGPIPSVGPRHFFGLFLNLTTETVLFNVHRIKEFDQRIVVLPPFVLFSLYFFFWVPSICVDVGVVVPVVGSSTVDYCAD